MWGHLTVCLPVVEIDIGFPRSKKTNNVSQCLFDAGLVHTWLFLNTMHSKEPFPILWQPLFRQVDEVMAESDRFVPTRLTHHNSVPAGKRWAHLTAEGNSAAVHKNATGRLSYRINSLKVHMCSLVHLEVSLGEWVWLLPGVHCPLMVKVWTVQPVQRDQHLQSPCEKVGEATSQSSPSCGANRTQRYKRNCLVVGVPDQQIMM